MPILSLEKLNKHYGALVVTDDLSFEVNEGEILGILGPNGAGKTTVFNLITGTVQPNSGKVFYDGNDVSRIDASARCQLGISRSFQVPHPFVGMTVFENILVGSTFGRDAHDPQGRALEVLKLTGMYEKANVVAGDLTLLDRKRLELARALATKPKLLLLDEIAGGLTDSECKSLLEAIRKVRDSGVSIVWIEHVVHALLAVADRLMVIDFGRKVTEGEPKAVMNSREVRSIYMGEDVLD